MNEKFKEALKKAVDECDDAIDAAYAINRMGGNLPLNNDEILLEGDEWGVKLRQWKLQPNLNLIETSTYSRDFINIRFDYLNTNLIIRTKINSELVGNFHKMNIFLQDTDGWGQSIEYSILPDRTWNVLKEWKNYKNDNIHIEVQENICDEII